MRKMSPDQLRESYLAFFRDRAHTVVPSSSVVPEGDPTLLFTNAGMNQFKDVLLGLEKRDYSRAASVQKCIRAGGKHNDLDEVGHDGRHLTFFEMLGNWSFGDYYKKESIRWAWDYVTGVLGLDPDRLYVSVYKDDDESWNLWHDDVGVPPDHIVRLGDVEAGDEENFWSMGPTGPCGPCTEIYYDQYPHRPPEPWQPGFDGDRFLEIWNLVFMEFNRAEDGSLSPLPMKSVDTGMGLDRVAAVMASTDSVFKSGLFDRILQTTHALRTGADATLDEIFALPDFSAYCVIADHVRTVMFSICDGARFANDGRGYVLRRILRRAVRHGRNLGFDAPFLWKVADAVVASFASIYPELRIKHRQAAEIIRVEEDRFFRTIDRGIARFDELARAAEEADGRTIPGAEAFKLYDTFGFPPDLTAIMAAERGLRIDQDGYEAAMTEQRERSRSADARYLGAEAWIILHEGAANTFVGYDRLAESTSVLRFRPAADDTWELCLRETPFYAESGGQVGDRGEIATESGDVVFEVLDTRKTTAGITHICRLDFGTPSAERLRGHVIARVDGSLRRKAASNHTATHLLHAGLHRFVSPGAFQAGSLVAPDRLRFDFSHDRPVTDDQLQQIERWVNDRIRDGLPVRIEADVPIAEAERRGAMMMFGEKYGDVVRVVAIGDDSLELCGGTHVERTSDIALFRIVAEGGVAAGVRRIEATTGERAFELAEHDRDRLKHIAATLRSPLAAIEDRVARLVEHQKELERRVEELTRVASRATAGDVASRAVDIGGIRVASARVTVGARDELLAIADFVRDRLAGAGVALLAAILEDKPTLVVVATDAAIARGLKAGDLVNAVAPHVEGRGGGKPGLAQAGGKRVEGIDAAVATFEAAVRARV